METIIVWFKTNLRVVDNEVLNAACQTGAKIIPVYCFDEHHYTLTPFGTEKTGSFRAIFLLQSLTNLDENLRKANSGLTILKGKPEEEIYKLAKQYQAHKVFTQQEIGAEEIATANKVESALSTLNCEFTTFETNCLYTEAQLPFGRNELPMYLPILEKLLKTELKSINL